MSEELAKVTVADFKALKGKRPITMMTAYDYPTALLVDRAGLDSILVGDSMAMVMLGYDNTLAVTLEEMLHHCRAVARGARRPLLIGDMPFLSFGVSESESVHNAGRFLKEAGMDAVKVEGGERMASTIAAMVRAGIPVLGHVGLTPQTASSLGGFKVQGRSEETARRLLADAKALEEAGCFGIVLEAIPDRLADLITQRVSIPTIGIGAGNRTDGQVLVLHDVLGLFDRFTPKFAKRYANLAASIVEALSQYRREVEERTFPGPEHSYTIKDEVLRKLY